MLLLLLIIRLIIELIISQLFSSSNGCMTYENKNMAFAGGSKTPTYRESHSLSKSLGSP
jgi:hypothetical protein